MNIIHPVVVAALDDVVSGAVPAGSLIREGGHAMGPQEPSPFRECGVTGDQHSTLTGADVLIGEKAEAPDVAHRSELASAVLREWSVARVLDQAQAVPPRELQDPVHVAREASVMHDHDRAGPL